MNVFESGWYNWFYGKIARRLDIPMLAITDLEVVPGQYECLFVDPAPGHIWFPFGVHMPTGGQTSFPYGLPVEPD